ncbi:hypothetical protein N431DRAFT_42898 [Stipitochalara longipes BDJ]|nr:hypothetical protein N431DRAFT_42898 [Stipitochalara longipes BDJ]
MASHSPFETIAIELFEKIISHIDEPRNLSALCLVSRAFYKRVVPTLYQSWTYHGLKHSSKSFRNFLQTVIWRPDLAAHVRVLDVREWGHCPRLENQYGCPWTDEGEWVNIKYDDAKERDQDWGYRLANYLFEDDGAADEDYEDSDAQSYGSDSSEEFSDSDAEDGSDMDMDQLVVDRADDLYSILKSSSRICPSNNEMRAFWDRAMYLHLSATLAPDVSQHLQTAATEAGLDQDVLLKHYASVYTKNGNFAVLVAYLLASLPNLQHLFMVFTEPDYWTSEQKAIQRMLDESFKNEDNAMLKNLETLHISSALHISPVGHQSSNVANTRATHIYGSCQC